MKSQSSDKVLISELIEKAGNGDKYSVARCVRAISKRLKSTRPLDSGFIVSLTRLKCDSECYVVKELIEFVAVFAFIKGEFDRMNLHGKYYSEILESERKEVYLKALDYVAYNKKTEYLLVNLLLDMLHDFWKGRDKKLSDSISQLTKNEDLFECAAVIEQGLTTYVPQVDFYNAGSTSNFIADDQLLILNDLDFSKPKFNVVCSVDFSYLVRYVSNIIMTAQSAVSQGGSYWLNVVLTDQSQLEEVKSIFDVVFKSCSISSLSNEVYLRLSVYKNFESKKNKTLFASIRFFLAQASKDISGPVFFLDAEVTPFYPCTKFLRHVKSSHISSGTTRGLKSVMPWRRYLASEFFVADIKSSHNPLNAICSFIDARLCHKNNWFLDQNAIFWAVTQSKLKGANVLETNRECSKFPFLQKRHLIELTGN